jgi:ATP-dependent helicase/nuclease subunit B
MLDSNSKIIGIPFGQCFLENLAKILIEQSTDPLELAQTLVLLPTKRSILNLQDTFQKMLNDHSFCLFENLSFSQNSSLSSSIPTMSSSHLLRGSKDPRVKPEDDKSGCKDDVGKIKNNQFLMLPRMIALADIESENPLLLPSIDNFPSSISDWKRLGLFTQLILKFQPNYTVNRALKAAKSLMHLIDEAETTGIDLLKLENLVEDDYAEHWQTTLGFLKIITHHWPQILSELGVIEKQTRIRQSLMTLSDHWENHPPEYRVVVAGTTGTIPATAALIKTILHLPKGQVILPGYDDVGSVDARKTLSHPQHTLQNLIHYLDNFPMLSADSRTWSENDRRAEDRQSLIHAAMDNDTLYLDSSFDPSHFPQMIECDTVSEEGKVIALMMRYYLNETTGSITLVSPNQHLSRLVEAELERWDLVVNSSSGTPLNQTVIGSFLLVIAQLWGQFDLSQLLTVLKHPLCMQGDANLRKNHLENIRHLEKNVLRQADFDIKSLWSWQEKIDSHKKEWFSVILKALEPFNISMSTQTVPLSELLNLHQDVALKLVGGNIEDSLLWQQNDGIAAREFFTNLLNGHHYFPPLSHKSYPTFFTSLMNESAPVRKYKGIGSRLSILGALEARLSHAEVIILGGLNENSWPPSLDPDPWLSRSMRQTLGLPALERRLGLSAHDFCSCFYAKHLLLTRSHLDKGTPTLASRWWQRLETVRSKNSFLSSSEHEKHPWKVWAKSLTPVIESIKIHPPKPYPPSGIRPKKLSATEIEKLMRDPYSIYAKHCLKLNPLLSLHQPLNPAEKGQIIHQILEEHIKIGVSEENQLSHLLERTRSHFLYNPISRVFWWHRFEQIADWFLKTLEESNVKQCLTEQKGNVSYQMNGHNFEITAIADRIDWLDEIAVRIIDYKTGIPPSKNDMKTGYSPQLILEALIAAKGGFRLKMDPKEVAIWHLKGGEPAGSIISLPLTKEFMIESEEGVLNLLKIFSDSNTPYLACPVPEKAPLYNNYAHLERLLEWC